jgi:hypothetical protein
LSYLRGRRRFAALSGWPGDREATFQRRIQQLAGNIPQSPPLATWVRRRTSYGGFYFPALVVGADVVLFRRATAAFRPVSRASSRDHSCAVPFACATLPPLLAISRRLFWFSDAKPRAMVSSSRVRDSTAKQNVCNAAPAIALSERKEDHHVHAWIAAAQPVTTCAILR